MINRIFPMRAHAKLWLVLRFETGFCISKSIKSSEKVHKQPKMSENGQNDHNERESLDI